ncbi:unnamed protein product [Eruca vesicaria subsp. sativa]|uniref:Uncharacterized protein n=1 Tax=Eruca vesicaria subsp. sativa TaxID=29727 RepID=A0ABC8JWC5_ERUVS|nr:unnamed protein product [Eruca vesicaria subsp. sativa]
MKQTQAASRNLSPREPTKKEKEAVDEGEQEKEAVDEENKDREEEKEPKEVEEEMEPLRDYETAIIVRPHGTESHAESFCIDCEARTAKLKGPTDTIGGPSNNAQSGKAHSDSVEDTGPEALKAMDGRLMKAVEDAVKDDVKDLKKTVSSLSDKVTLVENEVKILRSSGDNPSEENKESDEEDDVDKASEEEDRGDKKSKESEEEDDVDNASEEEDGGDKESRESEEEDAENNYIRDVTNEVLKEHGDVHDNMDEDTAQMIVHAEKHKKAEAGKAKNEKKRGRTDDGKEAEPSKKPKGLGKVRSSVNTRSRRFGGEKGAEEEESEEDEAADEEVAEEEAAGKKIRGAKKAADEEVAEEEAAGKKIRGAKKAAEKKAAEKTAAEKEAAKKAAAEKEAAKKAAAEKAAAKKAAAKKAAQKKPPLKPKKSKTQKVGKKTE